MKLIPGNLMKFVSRKLDRVRSVVTINELRIPPGSHLEALQRDRYGQQCIRVNDQCPDLFQMDKIGTRGR